ncbi:fatty-acid amide hydrolase 2 [Aplysia californica]|uniref:Fatty-acid amide hydrolase 2 n=1 Tax=Aplysia californica TaxID=6500 RepID=A0ABM0JBS2_APLCA|nr:fatty-acid amide hydrolase 2 [Aplysia californica]XP_005090022.1 fatty-acid amide hydrolase 2 [Aplysia californica]XP_035826181.1 fatty-acid amide hydrolase 2 [Aplysia californica]XP_035826184.1 fatty-acid amide hydrolase 2 [Aplysia californica]
MGFRRNVIFWSVSAVTYVVMTLVDALFRFLYKDKGKKVSRVSDPLLLMPASDVAEKIRNRTLRAEDVMAAYIVRAKEVNPLINVVVGEQYDRALRRAQELDARLDSLSQEERDREFSVDSKPLLGVPLSVKEAFSWTGMANTSGVPGRRHIRQSQNAPVLNNLEAAGAIPFIQTNVSEACMWFESSNYIYGCSNNAYNTSCIVGGSSGGEGSVLSSGASVIGIGSDIGGSIRMPCFFNGIFGHKASIGVVDNSGQFPIASEKAMCLLATGPMCRYASDLIPCLKVMAGPAGVAKLKLDTAVDLAKLRVISVPDDAGSILVSKVDPQLKEAQRKAAEHFRKKGATVTEQYFKEFRESVNMWAGKMNLSDDGPSFACIISGKEDGHVNCTLELGRWLVGSSSHTLPAIALGILNDYLPAMTKSADLKAVEKLDSLRERLVSVLGDDGVFLYPSHPKIAPYHHHPVCTPFNFAYTALFNALGFPVSQCPLGLSSDGLPLGLQVVAAPYQDHLSLAVARELEEAFGGWVSPGM